MTHETYILSPNAKIDIADIRKYIIQKRGKAQADKDTLQLPERMRWLAGNPCWGEQEMK